MHIQFMLNPPKNIKDLIYNGLKSFNLKHFPDEEMQSLACVAEDPGGNFLGGLTGQIFTNTLFVEFLWLDDSNRSAGIGSKLMEEVEQQAKQLGVTDIYLDTYTFQAPGFYAKLGFEEVGRYTGFPTRGVDKIFLQKKIA
ncbi:GNAT family N-acetyltransferase [Vibrio hepatarius]|uniref:GNAT family N-acetyltransferase n=1 Tax=Vibrio hepatarius TaxID=171383 RepID=UPI00142D650A|nr:GNAT family N-acetyltransferase [Vibrio hepatarius]NIY82314.1 GNAT family N-acetyltransferase [Vibrio hepatarius]NVJ55345.1 GNAT family N-acetyltransferase [Vibrionaceae bacterium]